MRLDSRSICSSLLCLVGGGAGALGCSADGEPDTAGSTAAEQGSTTSLAAASTQTAASSAGTPTATNAVSATATGSGGATASATSASVGGNTEFTASTSSATSATATTSAGSITGTGATTSTSGGGSGAGEVTSSSATTGEPPIDDRSEQGTCLRWNADHENMDEGTWSGDVATCDPGDISPDGRANALRLYNLYRWLADLPPVETSAERDSMAQACALIMEANGDLSHDPGMDWECWTQQGADGAGSSNITTGSSVASVAGYMLDPGNATTLGHRRWILSNSLGPIGIGSTGRGASCMQNLGGEGNADKAWVAWPPPGAFPMQAYAGDFGMTLNDTGWSVQSDSTDLGNATVVVTSESETLAVAVTQLGGGYGSRYAIRFTPEGWEPEAGRTYNVAVGGVNPAISYDIQFVDCG